MPHGLRQKLLFRFLNLWPPYVGSGVHVRSVDLEKHRVEVELKFRFWNKNYVGTQFGGSLYAMCDPFFMLILMEALGDEYIVWDKAAEIQFKKPGKSRVRAVFHIPHHEIERIREQARTQYKVEPQFSVDVDRPGRSCDRAGEEDASCPAEGRGEAAQMIDLFTRKRLVRFVEDHRTKSGQLPTFGDLESAGFARELVKEALRVKVLEEFYVTLTNGTVVKGFKPGEKS